MSKHWFRMASKGFTLIELLVVMGIIGVLATLIFSNFAGVRARARDTQRKSDLNQLKNALRLYYNDYNNYPDDGGDNTIHGCDPSHTSSCEWEGTFTAGSTVYMNQIPQDPLYDADESPTTVYHYNMGTVSDATSTDAFYITATFENLSDSAIQDSQTRCGFTPTDETTYVVCSD